MKVNGKIVKNISQTEFEGVFSQFEKFEQTRKEKGLPENHSIRNYNNIDFCLDVAFEQEKLQTKTAWLLNAVMCEFNLKRFGSRVISLEYEGQKLNVKLDQEKRNPIRIYRP